MKPMPVAEQSTARASFRPLAGILGSNPATGVDVCLFSVLCFVR